MWIFVNKNFPLIYFDKTKENPKLPRFLAVPIVITLLGVVLGLTACGANELTPSPPSPTPSVPAQVPAETPTGTPTPSAEALISSTVPCTHVIPAIGYAYIECTGGTKIVVIDGSSPMPFTTEPETDMTAAAQISTTAEISLCSQVFPPGAKAWIDADDVLHIRGNGTPSRRCPYRTDTEFEHSFLTPTPLPPCR